MVQSATVRPLLESDLGAADGVAQLGADRKILPTHLNDPVSVNDLQSAAFVASLNALAATQPQKWS